MVYLVDLWLPILLSGVCVFVVSSLLHMVIPLHKGDFRKLDDEEAVLDALREHHVGTGQYMFPCPSSMKDMKSKEMSERFERGPVGTLIVREKGMPPLGRSLGFWLLYTILVGVLVGYLATIAFEVGTSYALIYRFVFSAALLAYAVGPVVDSIWKGIRWGTTAKFIFDGIVYALLTAGFFGWLWPR